MCTDFHKNGEYSNSKFFIPRIGKTLEFNSMLQIKEIIQKSGFEPTMVLTKYDMVDSNKNVIATIWFSKNRLLDSISYRTYVSSKFEFQNLLQEGIFNHQQKNSFPFYIHSYSYLKTNKGNILIILREASPLGLPPIKTNDIIIADKDRLEFDVGIFVDSFQLDISLYKTTKDSSTEKARKLLEPILNSIKIY